MFEGRLRFDDFALPLDAVGGEFFFGRSRIAPVRHRMVATAVLESPERVAFASWERFPGDPDGVQPVERVSGRALDAWIEAFREHPLDHAVLVIDRARRTLRYSASPIVSVPVYLIADDHEIAVDWDYSRLLAARPARVQWDIALAQVAGALCYDERTIVTGVWRSTAAGTLVATRSGVTAERPAAIHHDCPNETVAGLDVETLFVETVGAVVTARALERDRTAVELSGGMDSALTSLVVADALGPGVVSIGAQFGGTMGAAQRARRELLRDRGGFDDVTIPAERLAPFGPTSLRRVRHGVWPEDENYPEMFEAIFGVLRAAGIDTLVSGLGGDELYVTYVGEDERERTEPSPPPFLTPAGRALAAAPRHPYPRSWLAETCWLGAAGQSQRLLRYGLWPVHPFHTPELARFVSRLPRPYRRDRRLLRTVLGRLLDEPVFEEGYLKERFDPVLVRGLDENRDYLIDLVRRSALSRHPGIDGAAVLAALEADVATLDGVTRNALFRVLKIAGFFQSDD